MKKQKVLLIVFAVIVIMAAVFIFTHSGEEAEQEISQVKRVELVNVSDYQEKEVSIYSFGQIEAMQQVDVRGQIGGEVISLNVEIGDEVPKGYLIAELDHVSLDVQVEQAEAGVEQAESLLEQALAGATDEQIRVAEAQMNSAEASYRSAETSLNNLLKINDENIDSLYDSMSVALDDSYIKMTSAYDIVRSVQETYFIKNDQEGLRVRDRKDEMRDDLDELSALIEESRGDSEKTLSTLIASKDYLSSFLNALEDVKEAVDSMNYRNVVADSYKTGLETQKAYINGAYSASNTLENNLSLLESQNASSQSTAESQLEIAKAGYEAAKANYEAVVVDPREVDISSLRSAIKVAEASYDLAKSAREKAFIRAPFSGKISSVSVDESDLVSSGQVIASMINENGLQARAFISTQDRKLIGEGASAAINGSIEGVVSKISPGIDPSSKKIEVIVAISDNSEELVVGEYVDIDINIMDDLVEEGSFFLPFESILIKPSNNYIYIVENGAISVKEVELGEIVGDYVEVKGIEDNTYIVKSTRGIEEGDKVEIR